jgi:hypothetical protein
MRIFNLTPATEIEFRGRMIPPNGGFVDIPLSFVPNSDRILERDGLLAFDELPAWFIEKRKLAEALHQKALEEQARAAEAAVMTSPAKPARTVRR